VVPETDGGFSVVRSEDLSSGDDPSQLGFGDGSGRHAA
jgi:hypothetical protein